ncbi:PREDICTED: NHL repeat-containing protein 2-like [Priapulus caudatus]|uniref:NHL repeat-containing protein 2-like n=1 Tax=Priapulus caudatus TaxID=37621 RepID=A0ABM1DRF4_PRICU|nr:PREDICTED: NHL repeat-containing protein 2-like [Priapulus caudatus]
MGPEEKIQELISESIFLEARLKEAANPNEVDKLVYDHIEKYEKYFVAPDFVEGLHWLNTSKPLSIHGDLHGKVTVLDFWTYCCINCMHILPDLHQLESHHSIQDGLVIIGVHSAKFDNEKHADNIASAVVRYGISHAVVNDPELTMWNALHVCAWPTVAILGPDGQLLLVMMGEGHAQTMLHFTGATLSYFRRRGRISSHDIDSKLLRDSLFEAELLFPGKVAVDSSGARLAISDTGHNRVVVVDRKGVVVHCVGGRKSGFRDGSSAEARLNAPQGLCWSDDCLYVADTENHAVRHIDLRAGAVTTVAGTGQMGHDREGGKQGREQPISSPWDVCLGCSPGADARNVLFIAAAGTHQIWALFLTDATWWKNRAVLSGTCVAIAGSGAEENRNNSYAHRAGFAQPSGLSLDEDGSSLYIADSESSSIRRLSLLDGAVSGVVGGAKNPRNLFAFGDVDGVGMDAKLQHALGVALNPVNGNVYVADSYNHKIKFIDLATRRCSMLCGAGTPGNSTGTYAETSFSEPGGLASAPCGELLYVADTNNNCVKLVNLREKTVRQFNVTSAASVAVKEVTSALSSASVTTSEAASASSGDSGTMTAAVDEQVSISMSPNSRLTVHIRLDAPTGSAVALTEGAPSRWKVTLPDDATVVVGDQSQLHGNLRSVEAMPRIALTVAPCAEESTFIDVECTAYVCSGSLCSVKSRSWHIAVKVDPGSGVCEKDVRLVLRL